MKSAVLYAVHGSVAVIQMDAPPVNGLGLELRKAIAQFLRQALETTTVGAIVLIGSDRAFSGGADVREFGTPLVMEEPSLRTVTGLIEDCTKPVVAAISGACMGGGFELALACHYRLARRDAAISLPEVKLGIMPGAGGTQRLPRAVGLEIALDMILSGDTTRADSLRETGVLDEIVSGDLRAQAIAFAERLLAEDRPLKRVRDRKVEHPHAAAVLATAETRIGLTSKGQPAPLKCLQAVAATLSVPFEEGLKLESRLCDGLIATPESKALRHVFAAERAAAKVPGISAETPVRTVRRVGIMGAGPLGCGIATCCLDAGLSVVLFERDRQTLDRAMVAILGGYESSLAKGNIARADPDQRLAALRAVEDDAEFSGCDLIIEAAAEAVPDTQEVFERLARRTEERAILASTDSYIDLRETATASGRPQGVVGLHFFSPASATRVMEVARHEGTDAGVLATCLALAKRLNKIPVVCSGRPGLIGDRMFRRYMAVTESFLKGGAPRSQVDRALREFGMASSPFRAGALIDGSPAGCPGTETGATDKPRLDDRQIVERYIYALANEGARILEDGIALRASDIDLISIHVCGFPAHRGGPMHCANETGLGKVASALESFAAHGDAGESYWPVSQLLRKLAATAGRFV